MEMPASMERASAVSQCSQGENSSSENEWRKSLLYVLHIYLYIASENRQALFTETAWVQNNKAIIKETGLYIYTHENNRPFS